MARATKSYFDRYVAKRRKDPEFERAFLKEQAQIKAVDEFVRALDNARVDIGMTKAELARQIGARPEAVRRLFSAERANPTLRTIMSLASALGLRIQLNAASRPKNAA